jgi:hypothetical protein
LGWTQGFWDTLAKAYESYLEQRGRTVEAKAGLALAFHIRATISKLPAINRCGIFVMRQMPRANAKRKPPQWQTSDIR